MGQFLDIAEKILRIQKEPMSATEIIDRAEALSFLDFSAGKTPYQTVKARISDDIRKLGENSRFKRTKKGVYALRSFGIEEYKAIPFKKTIKPEEKVLVFKTSLLHNIGIFNGITSNYKKYLDILLNPINTLFISRIEAERNPTYKQIISYIIVKRGNEVLRFIRGTYNSAHSMLKGRECIGFGGHVQDYDNNIFSFSDCKLPHFVPFKIRVFQLYFMQSVL